MNPMATSSPEIFYDTCLGQDFKFDKEKMHELFLNGFPEELREAGKQAMEKCMNKNFSKKYCASGVTGVFMCFSEELVMNCPANIWTSDEKCTAAKEYMTKCPSYQTMVDHE
uniref:Glucose 1,6-bisphosphate synthase n=1 Tax=Lygus hesperus TaxID=30085 RepID=A0A0A9YCZ3_LYGHE